MLTKFCPLLTTYLHQVDIAEGIPLIPKGKTCMPLTFLVSPSNLLSYLNYREQEMLRKMVLNVNNVYLQMVTIITHNFSMM